MPKIIITKGLPASGKTTWAKAQTDCKRVNKDDLRAMLDNSTWSKSNEKFILKIRDSIIISALQEGKNVIVDDTNLHPKHIERFKEIAKEHKAQIVVNDEFLDISIDECIARDLKRPNSVGEKVIRDMYNTFVKPQELLPLNKNLPKAVIFDIDGTLAIMRDRGPFDWHKVGNDELNKDVKLLLDFYKQNGYAILIFSGRSDECKKLTEEWLASKNIYYDLLKMRKADDNRKDSIIKKEFLLESIQNYFIEAVFDDRNQVVQMWRDCGLRCFQVANGNF